MFKILPEKPQDAATIEVLLDDCFGKDRFTKTVYTVRKNLFPIWDLSLVARSDEGELLASIRYWPLLIGNKHDAILLGPIAVQPSHQGEGIGVALIRYSMEQAKKLGHTRVVLVGDPEYYARFGFISADKLGMELPGPVEKRRFLIAPLEDGALDGVSGMVSGNPAAEMMRG